ncbi:hypothetical protein Tco_0448247 [Tanacetum coccineum]
MTTLADKAILSGADNRPPMLEKDMYDSWKSIIELYMMNRQHGRMILESVENGPLIWPTIEENSVSRPRKYSELTPTDAIQADCDVKATNINLQGLPPEVYALVSNYGIANKLWERIQLLMQGTSLTKQEREFHHNIYSPPSSIPQLEYAPTVNEQQQQPEFPQLDSGLTVPVFKQDPGTAEGQAIQTVITHNAAYQADDLDAYDSDCDKLNTVKVALMANLSHYGSNALAKVHNLDNVNNNMINQAVQYVTESQQAAVQNSNSSAQQDALILSVIEQLKTQIINCTKINLDNKSVNNTLTTELERYKEQVKVLKEGQNADLKKKESLMQTVTLLKNDFKKKESRNIDREISLEKKIKQLDNIVYKRDQSAQTKAQQLEPKLYDGNVIKNTSDIMIPDSEETLMLAEESYPNPFCRPTKVKVPKELPKVSMGFEHTKACFKDEIIPFVKALKDLFNTFDQYLIDELSEVQNVFHQMEQAVEQHRLESKTFEVKMNQVLNKNERLLKQVINKDIVKIIVNSSVDNASVNVHECEKCLKLKTELLNKKDFIKKETYDKLLRSYTTLEKYCISLEVDTQLNQENFQRDNFVSNQSALNFDQYFELNELKAQSQENDTVIRKLKEIIKSLSGSMNEDKVKKDIEEIEIINL